MHLEKFHFFFSRTELYEILHLVNIQSRLIQRQSRTLDKITGSKYNKIERYHKFCNVNPFLPPNLGMASSL
jgi:hypothetical protein